MKTNNQQFQNDIADGMIYTIKIPAIPITKLDKILSQRICCFFDGSSYETIDVKKEKEVKIKKFYLDSCSNLEKLIIQMKKSGYRRSSLAEFIFFIKENPNEYVTYGYKFIRGNNGTFLSSMRGLSMCWGGESYHFALEIHATPCDHLQGMWVLGTLIESN